MTSSNFLGFWAPPPCQHFNHRDHAASLRLVITWVSLIPHSSDVICAWPLSTRERARDCERWRCHVVGPIPNSHACTRLTSHGPSSCHSGPPSVSKRRIRKIESFPPSLLSSSCYSAPRKIAHAPLLSNAFMRTLMHLICRLARSLIDCCPIGDLTNNGPSY